MSEQAAPNTPPQAPPGVGDPARDLDVLWKKRGGLKPAYRQLLAYAIHCKERRSTLSPGGRQVAQLAPEEILNGAILEVLTSATCPTDGEELYNAVRRAIDNPLRTLEKSAGARATVAIADKVGNRDLGVADPNGESPGERLLLDEQEDFNARVIAETRRRLRSPNCLEAQLLGLILERAGAKDVLCKKLGIDGPKFDRLKFTLKNVAAAAAAELKKKDIK